MCVCVCVCVCVIYVQWIYFLLFVPFHFPNIFLSAQTLFPRACSEFIFIILIFFSPFKRLFILHCFHRREEFFRMNPTPFTRRMELKAMTAVERQVKSHKRLMLAFRLSVPTRHTISKWHFPSTTNVRDSNTFQTYP